MEYTPAGPTVDKFHMDPSFVRIIMGPLGCLSADTEFLTEVGWKPISTYTPGDRIAEWSPDSRQIAFAEPLDYVELPCEEFWHFHNQHSMSMVLSDEHRVALYDYRGEFVVKTAAELAIAPSRHALPVSFRGADKIGMLWGESLIRLCVAINADGHLPEGTDQVIVTLRKERKKARMRQLLAAAGVEWEERAYSQRPAELHFVFRRNGLEKGYTPYWWSRASVQELEWILDECLHWDGLANHAEQRFFSTDKYAAEFIQYAAHATGRRATIAAVEDVRNAEWRTCYTVQITTPGSPKAKVMLRGDSVQIDRIKSEDGKKYCFRTSTGFFVARHAGRIFVTGNSGKTTGCCYEVFRRAIQQKPDARNMRKTRWLVCRNTIPELETTTLPSWRQHFNTELGNWKMTSPITHSWRFPVGDGTHVLADIYFLGLDGQDASNKIRGMELTGAWLNEAKDIPRSVFDMITGRIGRYPPKKDGGPSWFGMFGDTNMPDDDHWMYTMAERTHPEGWQFFRQPGGVYKLGDHWILNPAAENLQHLPENYYKNQLAGKSDEWIRVFLASEYGYVADGRAVYPEYSDVHHVADLSVIPGEPVYVGADFGLTPAAIFLQKDAWGRWLVMEELVTFDVGAAAFGRAIKRTLANKFPGCALAGAWGDPIGAKRSATDEDIRTMFQILAGVGVPFRAAPGNNELVLRREAVASPLGRMIDGKPGLIIDRRCLKIRAAMSGKYCFRRVAQRGDVFADKPDKNEYSHVAEALQYVMLGVGEGRELVENKMHRIRKPNVITGTKFQHRVAKRRVSRPHY